MTNLSCMECKKFDLETKEMMITLFSQDELAFMVTRMAFLLKAGTEMMGNKRTTPQIKAGLRRDMDFASVMTGKFLIALEDKDKLFRQLKPHGVQIDVSHEDCPHQPKEGA